MAFRDEERLRWHEEKLRAEWRPPLRQRSAPVAVCIHCQNPFGINEGVVTDDVALCDVCNGD
jgi:hypothetical protein